MEKSRKHRLKEKRTLMHVINTCLKYNMGFQMYEHGTFQVTDFDSVLAKFKFREESNPGYGQSIFELQDKLHVYIKHHKQKQSWE